MSGKTLRWIVIGCVIAAIAPVLLAAATEGAAPSAANPAGGSIGVPIGKGLAVLGACLGAAGATLGGGLGIGRIGGQCVEAIARQPEASGSMFAPMIITAAMIEGGMLFALVICLLGVF